MSDFESMRKKHREDSMRALSFFVFLLVVFLFHDQYLAALRNLVRNPEDWWEITKKSGLVLAVTGISTVVSYFLGLLTIARRDLYYAVDNAVFKRRERVDRTICEWMLDLKEGLANGDEKRLADLKTLLDDEEIRRQIMAIFYRYIEMDKIVNPSLKQHAFTYWGDYFSSMMVVFWGALALACVALILVGDRNVTSLRLGIVALMVMYICLNLYGILRGAIPRKQFEIPKTQISEIHRGAGDSVLQELRKEEFFLDADKQA